MFGRVVGLLLNVGNAPRAPVGMIACLSLASFYLLFLHGLMLTSMAKMFGWEGVLFSPVVGWLFGMLVVLFVVN